MCTHTCILLIRLQPVQFMNLTQSILAAAAAAAAAAATGPEPADLTDPKLCAARGMQSTS